MSNEQRKKAMSINIKLLATFFFLCCLCLNAVAQEVAVFPQLGHTYPVRSVAFSHDGKQIFSSDYNSIKLWDINTGREIKTFLENMEEFTSVAFSIDRKQVLLGFKDGKIILFDTTTWKELKKFSGHERYICSLTFSPDGRQVLSGSNFDAIKLWDTNTGREIKTFLGNTGFVWSISFSPDGKQILSSSDFLYDSGGPPETIVDSYESIKLWDVNTGKEIKTFLEPTGRVLSVTFSPDGKQILSGSADGLIKLYDVNTGRQIRTFSGHTKDIHSVAFSPDGKQILSGSEDKTIKLWDVNTGREIRTFSGHTEIIYSVAFSPDGKQILSGSEDRSIKLWDANTGKEIKTLSRETNNVYSIVYSPNGWFVLSGSDDNIIKLWDVNTGRQIRTFSGHTDIINSVTISPDGKQALSGSSDKTIKLWDLNTGREIRTFLGHRGDVRSVSFSPDGMQALSGSSDNTVKLWDANSGKESMTFSGPVGYGVWTAIFSPDGKQVLFNSWYDDTIRFLDTNTGKEIRTFIGHTRNVLSLSFSPDGKQILFGNGDNNGGTIKLWDAINGRELKTFSGHKWAVLSIKFSPDGKLSISGSRDKTIKLWDTNTGRELKTFFGHTGYVESVSFSPDGKQIISGSTDGTLRLWDISTGKEIAQFISFIDGEWLVFTPDGYYNASPSGDKYLNVRVGNNVYGIDQYRNTFYRPQIVEARLQGRPDPVRVTTTIQEAALNVPPVVVFRSPENGATLSSNQVELSVTVVDQRQPIKTIKVLVNGRLVGSETIRGNINVIRGELELGTTQIRVNGNHNLVEFRLPVTLDPGVNRIEVRASNPYSEGPYSIEVTNRQAAAQNTKPNLYILAIGVNRYNDTQRLPELKYAVNDAKAIVEAFKSQEGKRYGKVYPLLIADGEKIMPTKENIMDSFDRLIKEAGPNDVKVLFMAGHGLNTQNEDFYFMPSDAAFNADGSIRTIKSISYREIQSVLSIPGQKLVFIDACHSAGTSNGLTQRVNNDRLINDLNSDSAIRASSVIFTSSKGNQSSLEMDQYRHGVFTYAILQGLKGEADLMKKGVITTTALDLYIRTKVKELTKDLQEPRSFRADGLDDFEMVILK